MEAPSGLSSEEIQRERLERSRRVGAILTESAKTFLDPDKWVATEVPEAVESRDEKGYCKPITLPASGGLLVLRAGTGTGKTTAISKLIAAHLKYRSLFLSTRRTYAMSICTEMARAYKIPIKNYLTVTRKRKSGEPKVTINDPILMISAESLHYVNQPYDIVVLDEITSILRQMNSPHHKGNTAFNWKRLESLVRTAKWVICADAYVDERTFRFLYALRSGEPIQYLKNSFQKYVGYNCYERNMHQYVQALEEAYKRGYNMHIIASTVAHGADVVVPTLVALGCPLHRIRFYHGKDRNDRADLANINAICLGLSPEQYELYISPSLTSEAKAALDDIIKNNSLRALIHTSTIAQGVDINVKHFHLRLVYADSSLMDVQEMMQLIGRVRELLLQMMIVCFKTPYFREQVREEDICRRIAMRDFVGTAERLSHMELQEIVLADGSFGSRAVRSPYNDMLVLNTKYANISRNRYRELFWEALGERGYINHPDKTPMTDEMKNAVTTLQSYGKARRTEAEMEALVQAVVVEGEELSELEIKCSRGTATVEEMVACTKSFFCKHLEPGAWLTMERELLLKGTKEIMKLLACKTYATETAAAVARRESWLLKIGSDSRFHTAIMGAVKKMCTLLGVSSFMNRTHIITGAHLESKLPQWVELHATLVTLFGLKGKPPTDLRSIVTIVKTSLLAAVNVTLDGGRQTDRVTYHYVLRGTPGWDELLAVMKPIDLERHEDFHQWEGKRFQHEPVWSSQLGTSSATRPPEVVVSDPSAVTRLINDTVRLDPAYERKLTGDDASGPDLILTFGAHEGETAGHVMENDKGYCDWALRTTSSIPCFKAFQAIIRATRTPGVMSKPPRDEATIKDQVATLLQAMQPPRRSRLNIKNEELPTLTPDPVVSTHSLAEDPIKRTDQVRWFKRSHIKYGADALMDKDKCADDTIIVQKELQYRSFARFWNWKHLFDYSGALLAVRGECYRCLYETIFGYLPHKPYFDLDIKRETGLMPFTLKRAEEAAQSLILAIMQAEPKIKPTDVLLCNSHYPDGSKFSYHVIVDRWQVATNLQARAFKGLVMTKLHPDFHACVDDTMYKSLQQFRIMDSHKYKRANIKVVDPLSPWVGDNTLPASLIQVTKGCADLPSYTATTASKPIEYDGPDVSEEQATAMFEMLEDRECFQLVRVRKVKIELKRIASSKCKACSEKDGAPHFHDKDNAFLWVNPNGTVDFHCYRKGSDGKPMKSRIGGGAAPIYNNDRLQLPVETPTGATINGCLILGLT